MTTKIMPTDTHVLHVGRAVDSPGKLIFRIENAFTREPIAWVKLGPADSLGIAAAILKLAKEVVATQ